MSKYRLECLDCAYKAGPYDIPTILEDLGREHSAELDHLLTIYMETTIIVAVFKRKKES